MYSHAPIYHPHTHTCIHLATHPHVSTYTCTQALLELPALTMLYLHGNQIDEISEVDKLSKLPKLKSLTLHGNPIEIIPGYRYYVLSRVTHLQTFDFGGITKADKATTETWKTMIAPKPRTKKRKSEEE